MAKFIYTNPNPVKGKRTGDCVIRAISIATNKKWIDVYREMCAVGERLCTLPNENECIEAYLEQIGWIKCKMPRKLNNKRYTVAEFTDTFPGLDICRVAHHIVCVKNGEIFDTWDSSGKYVGNYFVKK